MSVHEAIPVGIALVGCAAVTVMTARDAAIACRQRDEAIQDLREMTKLIRKLLDNLENCNCLTSGQEAAGAEEEGGEA